MNYENYCDKEISQNTFKASRKLEELRPTKSGGEHKICLFSAIV